MSDDLDEFFDASDATESSSSGLPGCGCAMILGIIFFIGSFPLLFWNEGRAVRIDRGLSEGSAGVVSVSDPSQVSPGNEGKLVHLTGRAETTEVLTDPEFGVAEEAIRLSRVVEMFQWVQKEEKKTEKKQGGGQQTITHYTYIKQWSSEPVDSRQFAHPQGHQNPAMRYPSRTWLARDVRVGAYELPPSLVSEIGGAEPVPVNKDLIEKVPGALRQKLQSRDNALYLPQQDPDQAEPEVGDLRITFQVVKPTVVSILGRQAKNSFEPFQTSHGTTLFRLAMGQQDAGAMFEQMAAENTTLTWVLRFVGFFVMLFGIAFCFQPIVTIASFIPFVGEAVQGGVMVFAAGMAFMLTLTTIALGWITYRPLVAVPLLVAVVGGGYGLRRLAGRRRQMEGDSGRGKRPKKRRRQLEEPSSSSTGRAGDLQPPKKKEEVYEDFEVVDDDVEEPPTTVEFACPDCGTRYKVPVDMLGKKLRCKCQKVFDLAQPAPPDR